jgi:threonine dehydrogenase-like Zn-dependent dehydrogenase
VLVTGAGPIGLLAALLARQRGFEVHVLDQVTDGPKPDLVRDLGAVYHSSGVQEAGRGCDIAVECTGVSHLILQVMHVLEPSGIACLAGVPSGGRSMPVDLGSLTRELVLKNSVVFGTVNANRRHYGIAAEALARADRGWLQRVINRRVPAVHWHDALEREANDVKPIIIF